MNEKSRELKRLRDKRFIQRMKEKGYFRFSSWIPNKQESKDKMSDLAAELRGEDDGI